MLTQCVSRRGRGGISNDKQAIRSAVTPVVEALETRRLFATAPAIDTTFGSGTGAVVTHVNELGSSFNAVTVQSDGKIVAVGTSHSDPTNDTDFLVARYNADGTPDTSFGVVVSDLGEWLEEARGVVVRPDGSIYVAGHATGGTAGRKFTLLRYTSSGALDTSFGGGNGYVIAADVPGLVAGMVAQEDGKLVLAGTWTNGDANVVAARFNLDGTLDGGFGTGGKTVVDVSGSGSSDTARAVAIAPDGGVIIGGVSDANMLLVRLTSHGALDTNFGTNGASVLAGASGNGAQAIAVQPNGKIVVGGSGGQSSGGNTGLTAWRFDSEGHLDDSFGYVNTHSAAQEVYYQDMGPEFCYGIAIQPDGRIVAVGTGGNGLAAVRFGYDGMPDWSFNSGKGYVVLPLGQTIEGGAGQANAVTFDANGEIVVAGHTGLGADAAVARFHRGALGTLPPDTYLTANGTLMVGGTSGNDYISLEMRPWEYEPGQFAPLMKVITNGVESDWIDPGFVRRMIVNGWAGDDIVVVGHGVGDPTLFNWGMSTIGVGVFIAGGDGNDRLVGGDYSDTISGNAGKDRLDGGLGDDRLGGNGGNDSVVGNVGYDRVYGDAGNDRAEAGAGNDRLYGGGGDDLLGGGAGSDSIYGGDGADTINGGNGGGTDRVYDAYAGDYVTGVRTIIVNPVVVGGMAPLVFPAAGADDALTTLLA